MQELIFTLSPELIAQNFDSYLHFTRYCKHFDCSTVYKNGSHQVTAKNAISIFWFAANMFMPDQTGVSISVKQSLSDQYYREELSDQEINEFVKLDDKYPERTLERLKELKALGVSIVGTAELGIPGVFSGLYIERVWKYNGADWTDYVNWIKSVKEKHSK